MAALERRSCTERGGCAGSAFNFFVDTSPEYGFLVILCFGGLFAGIVLGRASAEPVRWVRRIFVALLLTVGASMVVALVTGRELAIYMIMFYAIFGVVAIGGLMLALTVEIALGGRRSGR